MNRSEDEIYVVGGGPSLTGFDFSKLRDKTTIAVNAALVDVPNPDYFLTADTWYCGVAAKANFWNTFPWKVIVIGKDHKRYRRAVPSLQFYDEIICPTRFDGKIGMDKRHFATGKNSGFCGLQYAVLLNPKRICLLGFDLSKTKGDHYHNRYCVGANLKDFAPHFIEGLSILKEKTNIEVVSYSKDSPINEIVPFKPPVSI